MRSPTLYETSLDAVGVGDRLPGLVAEGIAETTVIPSWAIRSSWWASAGASSLVTVLL
jgi:hypothetical protein